MIDDVVGLGDTELTADTLERLAATAAELGADARAAGLTGTAERLREVAGVPINAPDLALLERWLGPAWLHEYKHHRPHTAIGKVSPITRLTNLAGQYI